MLCHTWDNSLFILGKLWVYYTASDRDENNKIKKGTKLYRNCGGKNERKGRSREQL
jgi:hypothetical protein